MRALRAGIPIVGTPAQGTDQATTLQLLGSWHAGRFLPSGSDVAQIRAAVAEMLRDPSYRETSARLSRAFDGAALAADAAEAVLAGASIQGGRRSGSSAQRTTG